MGTVETEIGPNSDNDIAVWGIEFPVAAKTFPDNPFDAVTPNRSASFSVHADTQPVVWQVVGPEDDLHSVATQPPALPVYPVKLP